MGCLIFTACQNPPFAETKLELQNGWSTSEQLINEFVITDTTQWYEIGLMIVHTPSYPYQNLYIKTNTIYPNGEEKEQVVPIDLANKEGVWYGKCRGETCRAQVILQSKAHFAIGGTYTIRISPHLRVDPVPEIQSIKFYLAEIE